MSEEIQLVIVVEGGCLIAVATSMPNLKYRLIDIDNIKESGEFNPDEDHSDMFADPINADLEKYTQEIVQDALE